MMSQQLTSSFLTLKVLFFEYPGDDLRYYAICPDLLHGASTAQYIPVTGATHH
jgi:hypothetical protein